MSNIQNIVYLMEPAEDAWIKSVNAGNMIMNRFSIDEDAALESSGIYYLKASSAEMTSPTGFQSHTLKEYEFKIHMIQNLRKAKGKGKHARNN